MIALPVPVMNSVQPTGVLISKFRIHPLLPPHRRHRTIYEYNSWQLTFNNVTGIQSRSNSNISRTHP